MKKFAYILMGENFNPQADHYRFKAGESESYIFTVRNMDEAKEKAKYCADNGFGVIELCGAFKEEKAREIIAYTGNKIGVGFTIHLPEQDHIFNSFFAKS